MIFKLRHLKRERERARRESRESELDRTRLHHHPRSHHRPNPKSHWSRRTPAPQRSRHRDRTQIASPRSCRHYHPLDQTLIVSILAPQTQTPIRGPPSRRRSPSHLYNTRSTSLQTHLPFLLFSHTDAGPRSRRRDRRPWPTYDRSLSFSIYLYLSLNFWSLSLPPSLNLIELFEFKEWLCFDFCFFMFIYWNFLL